MPKRKKVHVYQLSVEIYGDPEDGYDASYPIRLLENDPNLKVLSHHIVPDLGVSTTHIHEPYCGCPAGTVDAQGNI